MCTSIERGPKWQNLTGGFDRCSEIGYEKDSTGKLSRLDLSQLESRILTLLHREESNLGLSINKHLVGSLLSGPSRLDGSSIADYWAAEYFWQYGDTMEADHEKDQLLMNSGWLMGNTLAKLRRLECETLTFLGSEYGPVVPLDGTGNKLSIY